MHAYGQLQAQADLAAAEPAIRKAEAALNGLDKGSLTELKALTTPPKEVILVTTAVAYMLAKKGTNLKKLDVSWAGGKKMMVRRHRLEPRPVAPVAKVPPPLGGA